MKKDTFTFWLITFASISFVVIGMLITVTSCAVLANPVVDEVAIDVVEEGIKEVEKISAEKSAAKGATPAPSKK